MKRRQWLRFVLPMLALVTCAFGQDVSLQATVDRSTVRENESFTLVLRAVGQVRDEPDFAALAVEFEILQRSRSTQIQIVAGQTEQITEWLLQLMPKAAGSVTLPPIGLAGALSSPIEIEVLPALAADAPGDIFLELEAAPLDPYVQSQVIYTLRLFRGVSTGRSTLTPPRVSGGEAIVERLGADREYQVVRDDRNFIVLERRYAIFPQAAGALTVEPATFEAVVITPSGFSNVQRFRSEPIELVVQPPSPPPAGFRDAAWLPARTLTVSERWSTGAEELTAGVPQTRTVVLEAEGLLETQLPELRLPQIDGIKQYADQPELSRETTGEGLKARRVERFAVIAQSPGTLELPAVELPWWNVVEQRWELAQLQAQRLVVLPDPDQAPAMPAAPATLMNETPSPPIDAPGKLWQAVSGGLAAAWLATLVLWWRSERRDRAPPERSVGAAAPRRSANRRALRQLRATCDANRAGRARELLLEWAQLHFPQSPPRSLGALASRLPCELSRAVEDLERCLYGPDPQQWDGALLREALAKVDSVQRSHTATSTEALLPLYR